MTAATWVDGPLVGLDFETTSADVETARVVTATVVADVPGEPAEPINYLADPGIEIPAEATEIHGITTVHAREHGEPAAEVVESVSLQLRAWWNQGVPVVAYNAAFDLTVLDREMRRHGLGELVIKGPVLDPYVIDRCGVDRFREGKRRLGMVCEHYGVELANAHSSDADALAAVQVMRRIAQRYPDKVANRTLRDLWVAQRVSYRAWAAAFEQWMRDRQRADGATPEEIEAVVIDRDWPLRLYVAEEVRV